MGHRASRSLRAADDRPGLLVLADRGDVEPDAAAHRWRGRQQPVHQPAAAGDPRGQLGREGRQRGGSPASTGLTCGRGAGPGPGRRPDARAIFTRGPFRIRRPGGRRRPPGPLPGDAPQAGQVAPMAGPLAVAGTGAAVQVGLQHRAARQQGEVAEFPHRRPEEGHHRGADRFGQVQQAAVVGHQSRHSARRAATTGRDRPR